MLTSAAKMKQCHNLFISHICTAHLLMAGKSLLITALEFFSEFTVVSSTASKGDVEGFPHNGAFFMTHMFSKEVRSHLGLRQERGE